MHQETFELPPVSSKCLFNDDFNNYCGLKHYRMQKINRRLKLLENYLCNYNVCQLKFIKRSNDFNGLIIAFNHGLISSICFDNDEYESIISISHDHIVPSKLASKRISSIEITNNGILIAFVEPFISLIEFDSNSPRFKLKFKNNYRLKQLTSGHVEQVFPAKRSIAICKSKQMALLWSNQMPFRPVHANRMINRHLETEKSLIFLQLNDFRLIEAGHSINNDILQANFVANYDRKFGVLHKQKTSIYNLTYVLMEMLTADVEILFEVNIPMEKLCFAAQFTEQQDKILLLCDDESVMLFNIEQNALYSLHSSKPICHIATHPFDSMFVTCDPNGSISFYDIAFQNITNETLNNQSKCHPNSNMSVKRLQFISSNKLIILMVENCRQDSNDKGYQVSSNLLSSPSTSTNTNVKNCCCLKILTLPFELSFRRLINEYLSHEQYDECVNILRTINWNCSHQQAYQCLHQIFQHLISIENHSPAIDDYLESTLAAFLLPMTPIDYEIFEQILPDIRQLALCFFYHLIRQGSLEKAYHLAIELKSTRTLLLLSQLFKENGQTELSVKSFEQAKKINKLKCETIDGVDV